MQPCRIRAANKSMCCLTPQLLLRFTYNVRGCKFQGLYLYFIAVVYKCGKFQRWEGILKSKIYLVLSKKASTVETFGLATFCHRSNELNFPWRCLVEPTRIFKFWAFSFHLVRLRIWSRCERKLKLSLSETFQSWQQQKLRIFAKRSLSASI